MDQSTPFRSDLPDKASSYISLLPQTYSEIKTFVDLFRAEVKAGYTSPLIVAMQLKAIEELVKILRADPEIRDLIMDEIAKYPDKTIPVNGSKLEKAETGVKYDYSVCNSSALNDLYSQQVTISEKIKAQETFLKSLLNTDNEVFDPQTGERLFPPVKSSTSFVKITLAK